MNPISPRKMITHLAGNQCSSRKPFSAQTIEESLKFIDEILAKNLLCRHDVNDLINACQTIRSLEGRANRVAKNQYALAKVIKKVDHVSRTKPLTAKGLVSICHLQHFEVNAMHFDQLFLSILKKCNSDNEIMKEVAICLPYCSSEADFEVDIAYLFGANPSKEVSAILAQKRQNKRDAINKLSTLRQQVELLRKNEPLRYPDYLLELLENGYIQLIDHLIQMAGLPTRLERIEACGCVTFSHLSHVILQTRDAIIQKAERSIPPDCKKLLFLLGGSGAGKSTTLCFLRGDRIIFQNDRSFESQDAQSGLIGHDGATSCTFVPTTAHAGNLFIVDFPGFDDTNGPLVTLGMECALKALVRKYQPQILVLESITNIEGRAARLASLGKHLDRLFENKRNCVLGITKYTKDPDFITIINIEEQQRRDLSEPSREERTCRLVIDDLVRLNDPALADIIQQRRAELERLQRERELRQQQQSLPDTEEKIGCRRRICEKEAILLREIGLGRIIRFGDPSDHSLRETCLENLLSRTDQETIFVRSENQLDETQKELVKNRFVQNLTKELESKQDYNIKFQNFADFEKSVLESSLINAIFSEANPEIGAFLHLPEIDPIIVREFDKTIVNGCVRKYMESIIGSQNTLFINRVIEEIGPQVPRELVTELKTNLRKLQEYIFGLLGERFEDEVQAQLRWNELQRRYTVTADTVDARFALPNWAKVLVWLPAAIPGAILTFVRLNAQRRAIQKECRGLFENCNASLVQMHSMLQHLKDIEKIIEKQEVIDRAFNRVILDTQALDTLVVSNRRKINAVREIYGERDWDNRVEYLADRISLNNFDPANHVHLFYICAYATVSLWSCAFEPVVGEPNNSCIQEQLWDQAFTRALSSELAHILVLSTENVYIRAENMVRAKAQEIAKSSNSANDCVKRARKILGMQDPLARKKTAALVVLELMKQGLTLEPFCAVSIKNPTNRIIIQVLGIGNFPDIVDANDITKRDLPLIRALLGAAVLKAYKREKKRL